METKKLIGVWDLFLASWNYYTSNFPRIIGISLLPLIIGAASYFFVGNPIPFAILSFAAAVAALLARLALLISVSSSEGMPSVGDSYKRGMNYFWAFLWVSILSTLASMGGFLLLIIPGIIVGVLISFSNYTLIVDQRKGISALTLSWAYVKGYWWPVFGRFIFAGIIILLVDAGISLIVPGQGTAQTPSTPDQIASFIFSILFILPFMTIYGYLMYKSLKEIKTGISLEAEESATKNKIVILSILGIVAIILLIVLAVILAATAFPFILDSVKGDMPSSGIVPFLDFLPR